MPRKKDDDLFDAIQLIAKQDPKLGLILTAAFGLGGAIFVYGVPKSVSGFGFLIGWVLFACAVATCFGAVAGTVTGAVRRQRLVRQKSIQDIHDLTWKQFEEVVADAYRAKGYKVQERGGSYDGGIDLVLIDPAGLKTAVQCKQWKTWQVGSPKIREFVGALAGMPDASRGIYVSWGNYSADAQRLAKQHGIQLIDGTALLNLLHEVNGRVAVPSPLPANPIESPGQSPACPKCGSAMVLRTAKQGANSGGKFWGCREYPRCRGIVASYKP